MFRVPPGHAPYGTPCGVTKDGVAAISNGNDWYLSAEHHVFDGAVTGVQYQCVEFARRWLLIRKGLWLPDLHWAAHIISMNKVLNATTAEEVRAEPKRNKTAEKPVVDSLLIYPSSEDFPPGHVAVIVEVTETAIRIADQNNRFEIWPEGQHYSEELPMTFENGIYTIQDTRGRVPLGWLTFPDTPNRPLYAPLVQVNNKFKAAPIKPFELKRVTFKPSAAAAEAAAAKDSKSWLDLDNKAQRKFVDVFGLDTNRTRLDEAEANYYTMNVDLWLGCARAGNSLHRLAMAATKKVLADDALMKSFGLDEKYWGRIRRSFETQPYALTGRFDFVVDAEGKHIKSFEYNADSASTLLECGVVQQKWAEHVGVAEGTFSSGGRVTDLLEFAWSEVIEAGVIDKSKNKKVHFLVDDDDEEQYTALYIMEQAEKRGLDTELLVKLDGLEWRGGKVVDKSTGTPVVTVWKTWSWDTAFTDAEAAAKERPAGWTPKDGDAVRLSDVLLGDESIKVFEPLWKTVMSNKGLYALMWEMEPEHPNMLRTEFALSKELQETGYAKKPIVGRQGMNVEVFGPKDAGSLHKAGGKFGDRELVYQELFQLPKRDDYYAILGGWMIGSMYGGTGLREDKSIITNVDSPFSAIRVQLPFKPTLVDHDNAHEDPYLRE